MRLKKYVSSVFKKERQEVEYMDKKCDNKYIGESEKIEMKNG